MGQFVIIPIQQNYPQILPRDAMRKRTLLSAGVSPSVCLHRRQNRGAGGLGPLTFLFEGANMSVPPLEKCSPIFELKVTPYFQS